jgi:protein-glutamine gamma-glutamyltransferase
VTGGATDARRWIGSAFGAAQLASVAAGLLPWPVAVATLAVTWWVARRTATAGAMYLRVAQVCALILVSAVGLHVVLGTHTAVSEGRLDPLAALRSLTWLLLLLTLMMAPSWRTIRDYRAWIGVTAGLLVAAAAPPSGGGRADPASATLIVAWGVLLVAAMMLQRAAVVSRASVVAVPDGEPRQPRAGWDGLRLAGPILVSVVAGGLVFLALPGTAGGAGVPFRLAHDLLHSGPRFSETRTTAGVDTSGSGDLDLRVRGRLATTPLLRVPAASPALWRGTIYQTYSGQAWHANSPFSQLRSESGNDLAVPGVPADPPAPGAVHRRYLVQPQSQQEFSLVWAPGVLLRLAGSGLDHLARGPAFTRVVTHPGGSPYTVTAAVPTQSLALLNQTPAAPTPDGVWTALPSELPSRIATLARAATTGATTRYEQVTDLERYLRSHEKYSLTSPVPAGNQDAVDDFLFRDHVGFCEQFASAEAVMLRTLGVPARVVSGLAYGERDGATRLLRASDAHAWVEVDYPNAGWVPTDPTAGVTLLNSTTSDGNWLTRAAGRLTDAVPGGGLGVLIILIALALAAMAGLRIADWRPRLPGRSRRAADSVSAPVLAAFHRFAVRRRRRRARAPNETAREYVARTAAGERLDAAVGTLERESYGAAPPDEPDVYAAVAAFDEIDAR